MSSNRVFNRWKGYWFLLLFIMVQIIIAGNVISNDHASHIMEMKNNAEKNLHYLHNAIQEELQHKEYVSARNVLQKWGASHEPQVIEIVLTAANGFPLGHYQSGLASDHFFTLTSTIPYQYNNSVNLKFVADLDTVFRRSTKFAIAMGSSILLFSLFLTFMTWLYIRQKKFSLALHDSEEKYRSLVDNAPDVRCRTDLEGNIVFISQSAHKVFGYTAKELIGKNMAEFYINPEKREDLFSRLQQDGYANDFVVQLKRKDGSIWWASLNVQSRKDHNGNVLGVERVSRDVTKRMEAELHLQEREAKLSSIFRTVPIGIGVAADRVFMDVNDRFCEMVGYSKKELLGENARMIYPGQKEYDKVGQEQLIQLER